MPFLYLLLIVSLYMFQNHSCELSLTQQATLSQTPASLLELAGKRTNKLTLEQFAESIKKMEKKKSFTFNITHMQHLHYIATNPAPQKQHKEGSPYLSDCSRLILLAQLAVHYKTTQQEDLLDKSLEESDCFRLILLAQLAIHYKTTQQEDLLDKSLEELKKITTDGHAKKAAKKKCTKPFKSFFRIVYKTVKIKKFDELRWHLFSLIGSMQKLGIDTTRFIPEEYAEGLSRASSRDDYITLANNCYKDFKFIFEYEADTLALEEMFKKINQYETITHITKNDKRLVSFYQSHNCHSDFCGEGKINFFKKKIKENLGNLSEDQIISLIKFLLLEQCRGSYVNIINELIRHSTNITPQTFLSYNSDNVILYRVLQAICYNETQETIALKEKYLQEIFSNESYSELQLFILQQTMSHYDTDGITAIPLQSKALCEPRWIKILDIITTDFNPFIYIKKEYLDEEVFSTASLSYRNTENKITVANIRKAICYALSYYFKRKEKECNQWLTIKNTFNAWVESEKDPEGPAHSVLQLLKEGILDKKILPGIDRALALTVLKDFVLITLKTIFRENIDSMIKLFKKNKDILLSTAIMISGIPLIVLLCIILECN